MRNFLPNALFALSFSLPLAAHSQSMVIDVPGVHYESGSEGTQIVAPGVNLKLPNEMPEEDTVEGQHAVVATSSSSTVSASYVNSQLAGMDFSGQNLKGADFSNATLTGANFSGANLAGAKFINADLTGANLTDADLTGADLTNATLKQALVVNARFENATLMNVDMNDAIRSAPVRADYQDSRAIASALKIDESKPYEQRKIDLTVNFDFNSDQLTKDGERQVSEIAKALDDAALKKAHIIVEGHTDNVGGVEYNQNLSLRRADRVMSTLTQTFHIQPDRLSAKGYGKSRPVASNESEIGRAQNRRVTLVNIGK